MNPLAQFCIIQNLLQELRPTQTLFTVHLIRISSFSSSAFTCVQDRSGLHKDHSRAEVHRSESDCSTVSRVFRMKRWRSRVVNYPRWSCVYVSRCLMQRVALTALADQRIKNYSCRQLAKREKISRSRVIKYTNKSHRER